MQEVIYMCETLYITKGTEEISSVSRRKFEYNNKEVAKSCIFKSDFNTVITRANSEIIDISHRRKYVFYGK